MMKKVVFQRSSSPIRAHRCTISELLERLTEENVISSKKRKSFIELYCLFKAQQFF